MMFWLIVRLFFGEEVKTVAVVYATLIVKGKKTISEVPEKIREQVKSILVDLECSELAVE